MYVLLKQEVWRVQYLKGINCSFAAASQNLIIKPVRFLNYLRFRAHRSGGSRNSERGFPLVVGRPQMLNKF